MSIPWILRFFIWKNILAIQIWIKGLISKPFCLRIIIRNSTIIPHQILSLCQTLPSFVHRQSAETQLCNNLSQIQLSINNQFYKLNIPHFKTVKPIRIKFSNFVLAVVFWVYFLTHIKHYNFLSELLYFQKINSFVIKHENYKSISLVNCMKISLIWTQKPLPQILRKSISLEFLFPLHTPHLFPYYRTC